MKLWNESRETLVRVRDHFRKQAMSFDALYEDETAVVNRLLRAGLFVRRKAAVAAVGRYDRPRVLDVGCGSGRVAEVLIEAGVGAYVGVDFSEPMIGLARSRLSRFTDIDVQLVADDFLNVALDGTFDVVTALGLFDYLAEPHRVTRKIREVCSGQVVASFPRWTWLKGPLRRVRYEMLNDCPIYDYTERELRLLFLASGFSTVDITVLSDGHLVTATV